MFVDKGVFVDPTKEIAIKYASGIQRSESPEAAMEELKIHLDTRLSSSDANLILAQVQVILDKNNK